MSENLSTFEFEVYFPQQDEPLVVEQYGPDAVLAEVYLRGHLADWGSLDGCRIVLVGET